MSQEISPTVINIISGKGGTGKTLLACVLADMLGNAPDARTVVVDLDFYVRGLTSLLYFHREEKLHIVPSEQVTVANFFTRKTVCPTKSIAVAKYRSFDVVPAVHRIDEKLNFQELGPHDRNEAKCILKALLASLSENYRFIILDSRAGYDELVAATHELSNVSICVEEQDSISRVTSDNLVSQLSAEGETPIFRLVNKARGIKSEHDVISESRSVTDLGFIPFDMDILNNFGALGFWDVIGRSLYQWSLARSWNILSSKLQLGIMLQPPRISPVFSERTEGLIGILGSKERIIFVYGLVLAFGGLTYGLFGRNIIYMLDDDPARFLSLLMGIFGVAVAVLSVIHRSKESINTREKYYQEYIDRKRK